MLLRCAVLCCRQALERLGRLEEGNVSEAFSQLSARAAELVAARRKGCEALSARFEAPLKEAVSPHSRTSTGTVSSWDRSCCSCCS